MNAEQQRLADQGTPWKKWGPYLSERQCFGLAPSQFKHSAEKSL